MIPNQAEEELETSAKAYDLAIKNLDYLKYRRTQQGGGLTDSQQKQFKTETRNKLFHAMRKKELGDLIAQLEEDIKNKDALCAKCSGIIYYNSNVSARNYFRAKHCAVYPDILSRGYNKAFHASCDGHVVYGTGCFTVEDTVTIKSDLDMSVGKSRYGLGFRSLSK